MEQDQDRQNRAAPIGEQLASSLARIQAIREKIPPEERNHPVPALRLVRSPPAPTEVPITKAELARLLAPLEVIYGSRSLNDAETRTKYQIFYAVLGHLPERRVRLAVERYCKSTEPVYEFFPKPAQLLKLSKI